MSVFLENAGKEYGKADVFVIIIINVPHTLPLASAPLSPHFQNALAITNTPGKEWGGGSAKRVWKS